MGLTQTVVDLQRRLRSLACLWELAAVAQVEPNRAQRYPGRRQRGVRFGEPRIQLDRPLELSDTSIGLSRS